MKRLAPFFPYAPSSVDLRRFTSKVDATGPCWIWTAAMGRGNYGVFKVHGIQYAAHRVAYLWCYGSIDPDLELDHLCRNTACVNPFHLEQVTQQENMRRVPYPSQNRKRKVTPCYHWRHSQTHCKHGQLLEPPYVYIDTRGYRVCKACRALAGKVIYYRKKRERDETKCV